MRRSPLGRAKVLLCVLKGNSGRCRSLGTSGGHPDLLSDGRHDTPCSELVIDLAIIDLAILGSLSRADMGKWWGTLAFFALKFYDLLDLEYPPKPHDCPVELFSPCLTT